MFKLFYVIFMNLFRAPYMIPKMRFWADHPEIYSEEKRYSLVRHVISLMNKTGNIHTISYGNNNLPKNSGYIMYPNHQGKYDVLGIMNTHLRPCSFVMDKKKSYTILVREFVDLVDGKRLEINNPRQGMGIISQVAESVKQGKAVIIFPEGGYENNNRNILSDFKPGSFKIALKSKVPIVPVALIDSYKVFNAVNFGKIMTYVHYLEPIYYEEYKGMKTREIALEVRKRIEQKINEEKLKLEREKKKNNYLTFKRT
ncbi:lysophospholipid acyltransferase family protein [Lachnobacterium bovis]|uniref:1-acyl-sn-glycerol-3-phosphate acyltransferase n=3 Tax=Lachnobacterium bovis TaxID=140626 RepID=A0A1H9PQP9_9FIRM|nr:lysophospholipid acyltransferase family protein [Lachnobacterium bovis]SER50572.1 1-acyl-sn-glycerol-3-phosphate acyltransferase [Lachnobacterium bovis]